MDILKTEKVCFDIHNIRLCNDISITVKKGAFTGIIGPNGSGKSTFLKQVYGVLKPTSGVIFLHGEDISGLSNRKRAENMGVLAQENFTEFPFNVEEVTAMGRSMYHTLFQGENDTDRAIVSAVLQQVNMEDKRKQCYATLSGGEKQRVLLVYINARQYKIVKHEYLKGNLYRQVFVGFDSNSSVAVFESLDCIGIINCKNYELHFLDEDAPIVNVGDDVEKGLLSILTQKNDKCRLIVMEKPFIKIASTNFISKDSFLLQDRNKLFLGTSNKISAIEILN